MRIRVFTLVLVVGASSWSRRALSQQGVAPERQRTLSDASTGRARVHGNTLEVAFPVLAMANVGCALTDSPPRQPRRRRYYWLATASYPESSYPHNRFQQIGINVELPADLAPTKARLDSALAAGRVYVREAAGEPPMEVHTAKPDRTGTYVDSLSVKDGVMLRIRLVVEGKDAVQAFLSARSDSVSLSWCQRDRALSYVVVPLERR